ISARGWPSVRTGCSTSRRATASTPPCACTRSVRTTIWGRCFGSARTRPRRRTTRSRGSRAHARKRGRWDIGTSRRWRSTRRGGRGTVVQGSGGGDELGQMAGGGNFGWPLAWCGEEYGGASIATAETDGPVHDQPVYYWDPVIALSGAQWYMGNEFQEWRGRL